MWFAASFGMSFALQMIEVIIGWSVYSHHQSALDLGWIGLAEFIPLFVLALPAGHIADRFPRRYVLAVATTLGVWCRARTGGGHGRPCARHAPLLCARARGRDDDGDRHSRDPRDGPDARSARADPERDDTAFVCRPGRGRDRPGGRRSGLRGLAHGGVSDRRRWSCLRDRRGALDRAGHRARSRVGGATPGGRRALGARGPASSCATRRSCSARSCSICSRFCSVAPWRCCRSSPLTICTSARPASACCARVPRPVRCSARRT